VEADVFAGGTMAGFSLEITYAETGQPGLMPW